MLDPQDEGVAELGDLAELTAADARAYLDAVAHVAGARAPQTALPVLLLAVAQVGVVGARLGALADLGPAPAQRAPGTGGATGGAAEGDLATGLAAVLGAADDYADAPDPLLPTDPVAGRVSRDLAAVAEDLAEGLRWYGAGRPDRALAAWQASYPGGWGARAASAHRVLVSLLGHVRGA